jgi:hypothetical protein
MIVCSDPASGLRFAIADRLVMTYEFFMPRDPFFVRHQLKDKISGLPLKDIRSLTAEVLEQCLPNIKAVAYVYPFTRTAHAKHSRLLRRVAQHAGPGKREPLHVMPLHRISLNGSVACSMRMPAIGEKPDSV